MLITLVVLAVSTLFVWRARRYGAIKLMISYKHQDQTQAIAIQSLFEQRGFNVWIDLDIRAGEPSRHTGSPFIG